MVLRGGDVGKSGRAGRRGRVEGDWREEEGNLGRGLRDDRSGRERT